jgi:polyisoprenoid-binding protein YceI
MKTSTKWLVVFFTVAALAAQANAEAPKWDLDPAHSGIYFGIKHIYSEVRGHFGDVSGTVLFSPDDLAGSRFDFEVSVKSINTANSKRDRHLTSPDFFDAEKYPVMTFKSTAVKHVKDDQYTVDGEMTVKDVTQTISLPFTFMGVTANPFDEKSEVAGFEARMQIDRLSYNVGSGKYYEMGVVGKDVDVLISLEVTRKK